MDLVVGILANKDGGNQQGHNSGGSCQHRLPWLIHLPLSLCYFARFRIVNISGLSLSHSATHSNMGSIQRVVPTISDAEAVLPGNGMPSREDAPRGVSSALFKPLEIGNGTLTLSHRIILAPLTRNRGVPLKPNATPDDPNRIWYPDSLITEYYVQRTTPGGLLITEGLPPNLEGNGMPGVPGLFCDEQKKGCRCWGRKPFSVLNSLMIFSRDKLLKQHPKSLEQSESSNC